MRREYLETVDRCSGVTGDLLAHSSPDRKGDAEAHFQAILAAVPSHAEALTGMGLLRLRQERFSEADQLFQRAIAAGSRTNRVANRESGVSSGFTSISSAPSRLPRSAQSMM